MVYEYTHLWSEVPACRINRVDVGCIVFEVGEDADQATISQIVADQVSRQSGDADSSQRRVIKGVGAICSKVATLSRRLGIKLVQLPIVEA